MPGGLSEALASLGVVPESRWLQSVDRTHHLELGVSLLGKIVATMLI